MRGLELVALYLLIGVGVTAAAVLRARAGGWLDAGLLFAFWPLYGPFLLLGATKEVSGPQEIALPRAEGLQRRLESLDAQVGHIDGLLLQPDFRLEAAQARQAEHEARGEARAAARVAGRIESIRQLERRRAQLTEGLAEARELMAQLRVQAEIMRVTGGSETDTAALVQELECRVEGLDAILAEPVPDETPETAALGMT